MQFHFGGSGGYLLRSSRLMRARSQLVNELFVRAQRRASRHALILRHAYDSTRVLQVLAANGAADTFIETAALPNGDTNSTVYVRKSAPSR